MYRQRGTALEIFKIGSSSHLLLLRPGTRDQHVAASRVPLKLPYPAKRPGPARARRAPLAYPPAREPQRHLLVVSGCLSVSLARAAPASRATSVRPKPPRRPRAAESRSWTRPRTATRRPTVCAARTGGRRDRQVGESHVNPIWCVRPVCSLTLASTAVLGGAFPSTASFTSIVTREDETIRMSVRAGFGASGSPPDPFLFGIRSGVGGGRWTARASGMDA